MARQRIVAHFFTFNPSATRRRMACARVIVLSGEAAIQESIVASSEGCQRSPTWVPWPVGAGPRFFFGTTLFFAINSGTTEANRGEDDASVSALTSTLNVQGGREDRNDLQKIYECR